MAQALDNHQKVTKIIFIVFMMIMVCYAVSVIGGREYNEVQWSRTQAIEVECRLLSPIGSHGSDGSPVTVWDCGEYGNNISINEDVFRWAKEKSWLLLKVRKDKVRIVGIKNVVNNI